MKAILQFHFYFIFYFEYIISQCGVGSGRQAMGQRYTSEELDRFL